MSVRLDVLDGQTVVPILRPKLLALGVQHQGRERDLGA